jgi:hypothetical protein
MKKIILLFTTVALVLSGCETTPTGTNPTSVQNSTPTTTTQNPLQDKPLPEPTFRTTFALQTDKTTANVGDLITLKLALSNAKQPVTTVSTTLRYDEKFLKIEKIDTSGSRFPMVFKEDKEKPGVVDISMSNNTGGVSGNDIPVVSIQFKVLTQGDATITIDGNKTSVLMEDNTNVAPLIDTLPTVHLTLQGSAKVKR